MLSLDAIFSGVGQICQNEPAALFIRFPITREKNLDGIHNLPTRIAKLKNRGRHNFTGANMLSLLDAALRNVPLLDEQAKGRLHFTVIYHRFVPSARRSNRHS